MRYQRLDVTDVQHVLAEPISRILPAREGPDHRTSNATITPLRLVEEIASPTAKSHHLRWLDEHNYPNLHQA